MSDKVLEPTPVELGYLNRDDYLRGIITMIKVVDGKFAVHARIQQSKIIEGEVVNKGEINGQEKQEDSPRPSEIN